MKEFVMLFRNAPTGDARPSPEVMQEFAKKWDTWLGKISGQGKFISGSRLSFEGRILKPGNIVTDGPYAEVKEILGGLITVKAESLDDAFEMAHGCPILLLGGYVEVRPVVN
ncbi:MAG: YciI family protein [Sphingobacteriales bacterium]